MNNEVNRRRFIEQAAAIGGGTVGLGRLWAAGPMANEPEPLQPIGQALGIHPGRVVWVHDPQVIDWQGPGDGHWYQDGRTKQDRVDAMMGQAVCNLTGAHTVAQAWDELCRHVNQCRGKGDVGYRTDERIAIKPNWVGMIWREGAADGETYTLVKRQDYMNTTPQVILALVRQLTEYAGVAEDRIVICDTLAYLVHEYYDILHQAFPRVNYEDYAGKFGRTQVKTSSVPLYWSCRPQDVTTDYLPVCFAEADYLVNIATLKAHGATGVTLCGKNHFGSLIRWPVETGYYNMHHNSFSKATQVYREQVDLMGHAHLGGKTAIHLIDGLFSGTHPIDQAPRRWTSPPFQGNWTSSLLASQDPVAIDSVGFDFLRAEWDDHPRRSGVDDYLHEAALAHNPPSGTFYDPDHPTPVKRLGSLGVHEHWSSPEEKKYSRNLGTGQGIELIAVESG
ncbi:MAG: hypothetical protein A2W31_05710 [Planctomycetes bacterium RBG_16_64_10]|nr:MAG: hypothetical protein A2W31_05710 [Planctomycetes bacterium RBG_16_64_10]